MKDPRALLRNSLRANAAFSALSGLVLSLGASPVAEAIGLGDARILLAVGLGLLGFAGYVAFLASRPEIALGAAMAVVTADLAWVAGTGALVLLDVLSRTGATAAIVVADVVLLFALLQWLGVRRIRAVAPATAAG